MKPFAYIAESISIHDLMTKKPLHSVESLLPDEAIETTDESNDDSHFKYESNDNDLFNHSLFKDSVSSSPFNSYIHSDTDSVKEDDDTYECPSLFPRYNTNETIDSSNVSISTQSARSSASFLHNNLVNNNELSINLIYNNMETYAASIEEDIDQSFLIIDDEDEEEEDIYTYYGETEDDLDIETLLSVPMVVVEDTNDNEEMYDEDGDHSLYIPQEFRSLNININTTSYGDNIFALEQETDDNKAKKKRKSLISRKIKRHIPPKHIQQKIEIHKAIKQLRCDLTPKYLQFDVESPSEYDEEPIIWHQNDPQQQEKRFNWNIHPNNVRISDEACLHLVNLVEYQTDDESV